MQIEIYVCLHASEAWITVFTKHTDYDDDYDDAFGLQIDTQGYQNPYHVKGKVWMPGHSSESANASFVYQLINT